MWNSGTSVPSPASAVRSRSRSRRLAVRRKRLATAPPHRRPAARRAVPRWRPGASACRAAARSPVPARDAAGPPARRAARTPPAGRSPPCAPSTGARRPMRRTHRAPVGRTEAVGAASLAGSAGIDALRPRVHSRQPAQLRGSRAVVGASGFCARWRSRWSASTQASIASPTGTARMPTHGSWRPLVVMSISWPAAIDGLARRQDRAGRLHREPCDDGLAGGDAAQDAAGMVGGERHHPVAACASRRRWPRRTVPRRRSPRRSRRPSPR